MHVNKTHHLMLAHVLVWTSSIQNFTWGVGAMLEDERTNTTGGVLPFVGNVSGWQANCKAWLNLTYCDNGSVEADPMLDPTFKPFACR